MALLTVANLIDDTLDEIPGKGTQPIIRAINKVVRRIYTELVEPQENTFTTVPSVTTGTVAATQDSTAVTFSSGVLLAADPLPRFVQITGDNSWFLVTRNAADTVGVLSSKWAAATDSAATFTIVYPVIAFPSGVGEIVSIGQAGFDPLKFRVGTRDTQTSWWWQMGVGLPTHFGPYIHDENTASPNDDKLAHILTPAPQDRRVYSYTYKPRATFLNPAGATTQTIPLQDRWYEAIVEGVLYHVWKQEGKDSRWMGQRVVYEQALSRTRGSALPAAVIGPKRRVGGLWVYENRPIS